LGQIKMPGEHTKKMTATVWTTESLTCWLENAKIAALGQRNGQGVGRSHRQAWGATSASLQGEQRELKTRTDRLARSVSIVTSG